MQGSHAEVQQTPVAPGWVLELAPARSTPRVAGLSTALRLALTAQQEGASAIVAPTPELTEQLRDARLRLPILAAAPAGAKRVVAEASYVAHRATLRALSRGPGIEARLTEAAAEPDAPYGFAPIDAAQPGGVRRAERKLFRSLRKPQDGWTSRYLNRYVSLACSRLLVRTPLHPNHVSIGILGIGIAGALVAAQGGYVSLALGAFLFQMQSILDGCDGEMSRVTFRGSRTGEWLDTIGDDVTNYGFFAGAAVGLFRDTGNTLYLAAGAVTVVSGLIASGLEYRYLIRIGSGDLLRYPLSQSTGTGPFSFITPLFKRDTFVFLTLLAALAGLLGPMLCLFSLAALGILISVIRTELRLAREAQSGFAGSP